MAITLSDEEVSTGATVRILHVDDEQAVCNLTAEYLERHDDRFEVHPETDPRETLDRLRETPFDCVIVDYQMPAMTGVELLREVREEFPNLPVILFTGHGSEDVASEAIDAGVSSYVQKGGSEVYDQLANRIENAVGRWRSERRASVARERLLALYEQTDGFYVLTADWEIAYWNQEMAERTGLAADDVLGENYWEVFPSATETAVTDRFHEAMAAGEPTEFETHYEPGGYWAEVRAYPVETGLFVHSRDITADRDREQELRRRNHILESFANTVSHDLRNPLNVAEGKLQLAQQTGDFAHLEQVAAAHNRMRNLIDELLQLARGEELSAASVAVSAVAERAWETVTADATDLVVDVDVTVAAHETQFRRLFENLFWNAVEHGNASTIRVGPLDGGFFVEDDGAGIPAAERDRVFDSGFSTLEDSPGYGLSIVDGIAETHGWTVTATESAAGGARFEFTGVEFE